MPTRVLCLGNELMGDDAFGPRVATAMEELALAEVELVRSSQSGIYLLPEILGCAKLIVVHAVCVRDAPPGTFRQLRLEDLPCDLPRSPHYGGILDTLALCRVLDLELPSTLLMSVEGADCYTLGVPMHPAVEAAIPEVVERIRAEVRL